MEKSGATSAEEYPTLSVALSASNVKKETSKPTRADKQRFQQKKRRSGRRRNKTGKQGQVSTL